MLKDGYQKSGARGYWEKNLQIGIEGMKRGSSVSPTARAQAYARTGDKDHAFEWIEKAHAERDVLLFSNFTVEADFDSLRSGPRYVKLLQRIGLPQCFCARGYDASTLKVGFDKRDTAAIDRIGAITISS
jgi:hypothetical protein